MTRSIYRSFAGVAALVLLVSVPLTALAQGSQPLATCRTPKAHSLPKGSGTATVMNLGVQGGSLRPWSVQIALNGSITATGTSTNHQKLGDAKNALKGLLALADAEGFFSMKKTVGCLGAAGNPDVSTRFISIRTSSGTKRVGELGSCAATSKYDQLYAVLAETAGMSG